MICIIIINHKLYSLTLHCVESVLASEYQDLKIYLVDNSPEHQDYKKLINTLGNNPKVQILRVDNNYSYVVGVNYGLKKAMEIDPDYFMIMNNDTIIDKSAIGHLVDAARRHDNKAIVSGKVYYYDSPDIIQHTGVIFKDKRYLTTIYPGKNQKDIGQFNEELERDSLDDVFWLLPANLVKDVGYYCDFFFLYAEQGDYAQRARRKGYKLIFTPKAKLWHKTSMSTGNGDAQALPICYWRGQGRFIFQYRNLKRLYFIQLTIYSFVKYILRTLLLKNMARKRAYATLRGYFYGFIWLFNKKPNSGYNPYLHSK